MQINDLSASMTLLTFSELKVDCEFSIAVRRGNAKNLHGQIANVLTIIIVQCLIH